ncbi:DUF881 domain-containing protein [Modestobacter sp. NPDC049651]|uniref:DUF881 domain-containing protein n=1 Tax=unclassified Modestobacter TaxID=2643866 RepID=UPI0033F64996
MSGGQAGRPVRRRLVNQGLTGLLTLLLGLGATVQIRESREPEALPGANQEDLLQIFDTQKAEADRLAQQVSDARQQVEALSAASGDSDQALVNATQRAQAIAMLTGSVPASGPGVRVTITDPDGDVGSELLLDAVQELRGAGAEAIQLNGLRVIASTAFTGGDQVVVDDVPLSSPYRLLAIGPADDLRAALTGPGLPASDVVRVGGTADVAVEDRVEVTAVTNR